MVDRPPSPPNIVDRHLARAWQAFTPASNLREQVRARLTGSTAATMGAVGLGMASNARRPESAWASLQASGKLGALVGAGLLGVGLLSGYLIRDSQDDAPQPAALVAPRGPVSAPPLPRATVVPAPKTSVVETAPPSHRVERPASPAPSPQRDGTSAAPAALDPGAELALLRRAERAVRSENAALALALIGELWQRYPRSSLLEERRAIELLAHCGAGATDSSARARRFLRDQPRSVYAGRVRQMCLPESDGSKPAG